VREMEQHRIQPHPEGLVYLSWLLVGMAMVGQVLRRRGRLCIVPCSSRSGLRSRTGRSLTLGNVAFADLTTTLPLGERTIGEGGCSSVRAALDTATIGPPSFQHGLRLALDDTVNTLVSRTARATASPVRDDNLDTDSVCFCPAVATAAAAADGVATAVHSDRHVRHRVQGHTRAAVLRLPRPPLNATPEGSLAGHRARARHSRFLHGVDGGVARTG
jgi:hypothetical protein